MSGPSIRKTATLSAAIHTTIFLVSLLVLRHSSQLEMPSPYVVTLVGPSGRTTQGGTTAEESQPAQSESAPVKHEISVEKETAKNSKESRAKEEKRIEDRMAELAAIKKLEQLAKLRRAIVDIRRGGRSGPKPGSKGSQTTGAQGGSAQGSYTDKVTAEIHEQWAIPDTIDKNLTAVVAVKIFKDGTVSVIGFEKRSGSRVFDSLALKAIAKASPVSRPPQEMEMGIRFYP